METKKANKDKASKDKETESPEHIFPHEKFIFTPLTGRKYFKKNIDEFYKPEFIINLFS